MSDVFGGKVHGPNGIELERFNMADLDALRDKIKQFIRAHAESLLPPNLGWEQRFNLLRTAVPPAVSWITVSEFLNTHDGCREVLRISFKRSGKSDDEANEAMNRMTLIELVDLARRVALGDDEGLIHVTKPDVVGS